MNVLCARHVRMPSSACVAESELADETSGRAWSDWKLRKDFVYSVRFDGEKATRPRTQPANASPVKPAARHVQIAPRAAR